jgi:hypothetical protein
MSNSGWGTPIIYLSNQFTTCSRRSTRCQGSPERESSCVSRGKTTMAVGRFIYFERTEQLFAARVLRGAVDSTVC